MCIFFITMSAERLLPKDFFSIRLAEIFRRQASTQVGQRREIKLTLYKSKVLDDGRIEKQFTSDLNIIPNIIVHLKYSDNVALESVTFRYYASENNIVFKELMIGRVGEEEVSQNIHDRFYIRAKRKQNFVILGEVLRGRHMHTVWV